MKIMGRVGEQSKKEGEEMRRGVGIDVSKGKSMMSMMNEEGEIEISPREYEHSKEGLERMKKDLEKYPKESIKIVMEATGTYYLPVEIYLKEEGYVVKAENALKMKKYFDRELRKVKTDKIDSVKLAEYGVEKWREIESKKEQEEQYEELKFLSRQYASQVSIQAEQKVNLSNLCDLVFPGYYQLLGTSNIRVGIAILKKYYHPEEVLKKTQPEFIKTVEEISKEIGQPRAGISLAKKIYTLAQTTIKVRPNNSNTQQAVASCVDALTENLKASDTIITKMGEIARELPEYEVVKEMPGVGTKLGPRLIAEIGDIRKYINAGSLIASGGIDVPAYQSGKFEATEMHITKRGNKYLRRVGYEIMMAITKSTRDNAIYEYIKKKEMEGKAKKVAKIAGLNKFLRMYYGIVKAEYKRIGIWN